MEDRAPTNARLTVVLRVPFPAVPLRIGDYMSRVQEINLRFHSPETVFQPKPEVGRLQRLVGALQHCSSQAARRRAGRCAPVHADLEIETAVYYVCS